MDGPKQTRVRPPKSAQHSTALSTFFHHSSDLIVVVNHEFVFTTVNPAFSRLHKRPVEEIVGHGVAEILGEDIFQKLVRPHLERAFSGQAVASDAWFTYPDQPRFIGAQYYPVVPEEPVPGEQAEGRVEQVVAVMRDLTETKRAEEALRESEERYRLLFAEMPVGLALHEIICDLSGKPIDYRFLEVNPAFEEQTGLRASDVLGRRVTEVLPGVEDTPLIRTYGEVAHTGRPTRFELYFPPLRRHYSINAFSPKSNQFAVAFSDITELARAKDSLERYQLLSAHTRDIILLVRRGEGRLVEANEAAVRAYGYTLDELLGLTILDLRAPDARALTPDQIDQADSAGILFETVHRRKDGSTFPTEVSSLGASIGGESLVLSIIRDISERKQAERHRQEFLQLAAHEMKTPLAIFRGYVQILVKMGGHNDGERQALKVLERQTKRLTRLIQTLLDASRLQSDEWSPNLGRVDLCDVTQEAVEAFQGTQRVPIQLAINCEGTAVVEVDRLQVLEVVDNLLDNAVRYGLDVGPVEVAIRTEAGEAIVSVEDHGPGISEENQKRLFDPWYQTAPMVRPTEGMGLGLYISREIVRRHRGRIWVESEVGRGSRFSFSLPLAPVAQGIELTE